MCLLRYKYTRAVAAFALRFGRATRPLRARLLRDAAMEVQSRRAVFIIFAGVRRIGINEPLPTPVAPYPVATFALLEPGNCRFHSALMPALMLAQRMAASPPVTAGDMLYLVRRAIK